ncbi:FACT complex subunit Ssrp1 [Planococcus citri]|uniref:FACT complex subunit Ssrp1 n=1 Tax=Planococcus citri TaxID=170843 RepID=UPI0031F7DCE3
MGSMDLEFHDVNLEAKGGLWTGRLKFTEQNIVFKNSKTGKVEQLSVGDIELVNWLKLVGAYGIRLFLKNGSLYRFLGFKDAERDKISKLFRQTYKLDMHEKELSVKGWNWGVAKFDGSVLDFTINNITAFEIPLTNVSQCTTGKNEVTLEFHQNDDAPVSLMEMRFHIPSSELAGAADPVEAFHSQVMKQASVISVSGDAIAIFREIHILTPRGRYDIKIYPTFFQLHGKTFDYKVPMPTVIRLFLLPHKDGRQHFLVISLDPPIKQGQTRYHYLVLLFNQDDDISIELPFSEEEIQTKYEGRITKELSGPTYEVLGKIMKVLVNRKITTPGGFKGHSGTAAISCSYKAAAGYIYPLDRGFIYIHKPPIHIRFEEIASVNFARSGGSTRSFDFEIELKNGVVNTFSSIEKEEYGKLYDFINAKNLRVKNRGKSDSGYAAEDFGDSDQEAAPDAYLARVKREGKEKDDDDDDDDESTDEDFKPPQEESEIDDEYDSNVASSESGSGSDTEKKSKPKKEKKEKPKKAAKSESDKPRKKKRKDKDDNKPKRPPTAYMVWFNETREKIKSDNPGISFTDIAKKGGEMWKKLTSDDKQPFERKANKLKDEYNEAMKAYKESGGAAASSSSSSREKSDKHESKKSKSKVSVSPSKAGTGTKYKSSEFIEDDSSSSDSGNEKKKPKIESSRKNEKESKKKNESESESASASASASESESEEEKSSKKDKRRRESSDEEKTTKKKKNESESEEDEDEDSAESTPASDEDD